jgi:hypothetical protein
VRVLVAIASVALLLAGVAAPHHHASPGATHECVACVAGGALEARDATPDLSPPPSVPALLAATPVPGPAAGFPMGAISGQSPPLA